MYGSTEAEHTIVDELLDGVEDLRRKYLELIYQAKLVRGAAAAARAPPSGCWDTRAPPPPPPLPTQADEAKAAHWTTHVDPETAGARNGGAHFAFLEGLAGEGGCSVGGALTIADVALFDIVDLHARIYGEDKVKAAYPRLAAVYAAVAALPGVAAYLASPRRLEAVNANGLG